MSCLDSENGHRRTENRPVWRLALFWGAGMIDARRCFLTTICTILWEQTFVTGFAQALVGRTPDRLWVTYLVALVLIVGVILASLVGSKRGYRE